MEKLVYIDIVDHEVQVLLLPFCAMRYFVYAPYFLDDNAGKWDLLRWYKRILFRTIKHISRWSI